jgi:ubiquinone/menaquinone biosynthesis C-methylase UbiE
LVDKNNPSLPPFDWEKERLPYTDNQFNVVVCLDTLECINDFYAALEDLIRVVRRRVIISLPNCWRKVFKQMLKGSGAQASYGLPPEWPMDRHKWFINSEEVEDLFFYQAAKTGRFCVARLIYHMPMTIRRHRWLYPLLIRLLPERYVKKFDG